MTPFFAAWYYRQSCVEEVARCVTGKDLFILVRSPLARIGDAQSGVALWLVSVWA